MAATGLDGGDDVDHYEVLCLPSGAEGAALSVEQIEKATTIPAKQPIGGSNREEEKGKHF